MKKIEWMRRVVAVGVATVMLAATSASASITYVTARQWDPVDQEYYTLYQNSADSTNSVPVFARGGEQAWEQVWLDPGMQVQVRQDGRGEVVPLGQAAPKPSPVKPPPPPPPPPGTVRVATKNAIKTWHIDGVRVNGQMGGTVAMRRFSPPPVGAWANVGFCTSFGPGPQGQKQCYEFWGPKGTLVQMSGCLAELTGPDGENGDIGFNGVYWSCGIWPGGNPAPPQLNDVSWGYWYMGNLPGGYQPEGSLPGELGVGQLTITCTADEFITAATDEAYAGCVPEPATVIVWSLLGGLAIAVRCWRRKA